MQGDWAQNNDGAAETVSAALPQKSFDRFARYITGELGIKMPESKMTMVQSRLLRGARELRLSSIDEYAEYFFGSASSEDREYFMSLTAPRPLALRQKYMLRSKDRSSGLVRSRWPAWMFPCIR